MKIINKTSLVRGATLVDYAFSEGGKHLELDPADYVGIVAAYLSRGRNPEDIDDVLGKLLHINIGLRAKQAFDLFERFNGGGLWEAVGAANDITFTHKRLIKLYPDLNAAHRIAFSHR